MYSFKRLNSDREYMEYERLLYSQFALKNPDNWLCRNYRLIDGDRFRAPIPYDSQHVYSIATKGVMVAGVSLNIDIEHELQAEKI